MAELNSDFDQELRASVTTMMGFANLLKNSSLQNEDRERFLDQVISNGDHILQMLENALSLSKLQSGRTTAVKIPFNICDMIFDIIEALKAAAKQKTVDFHVVFKNPVPETISSDPLKIRPILTNILSNAVRYAGNDGFIFVTLDYRPSEQSTFVVEVDDSAGGSTEKNLISLQQVPAQEATTRPGLALSQEFAQALGGQLQVKKSDLGEGHCFSLQIPTGDVSKVSFLKKRKTLSSLEQKILKPFKKSKRLEGARILLAEDSSITELTLSSILLNEGAEVTFVNNGLEAVDAVKNHEFDLILMDIQMPVLDGLEATRRIRQLRFSKPILALTGELSRDDAEKSLMAGCDSHLKKPVQKETLIEEIQKRLLSERRSQKNQPLFR